MANLMEIYIAVNFFVIGTLFGSFFTLATYRIPRKQDIVFKRSYCPNCKHELGFFDLIPVLSYIIKGGKCKYCKEKISIRYILFEVTNGLIFLSLYLLIGLNIYLFMILTMYIALFILSGCYVSNKNLIKENINELISNDNLNQKKGVFILELAVAFILFAVFVLASYMTSRNHINQNMTLVARNNAMLTSVKNTEIALGIEYDKLGSFSNVETIDGIVYTTIVSVRKYSDDFPMKKDYVKKINTNVEYTLEGKSYNIEISTLKKKVI